MTFGFRARSSREKAKALNSRIPNGEKVVEVPKLAARAFAISEIRETFVSDRPMIVIRSELFAACDSAYTIPVANEPEPIMTISEVFLKAEPLETQVFLA
jgi:hypothetical protein